MANASDSAGESAFGFVQDLATEIGDGLLAPSLGDAAKGIPVIGSAVSGMESAYHLGAAGYDAITGDRDGATAHGAKAIMDAAMVVPGVNEAGGLADKILGYGGTAAKIGMAVGGVNGEVVDAIPTGLDDVAANSAVTLMNTFFGADDDPGTGTAHGEMAAGFGTMGAMMSVGAGPLGMALSAASLAMGGDAYGAITEGKDAPTSGSEPGAAAKAGQQLDDLLF